MTYHCPNCQRVLYNRRLEKCGFCGAGIPRELRFTPEEIAALDHELAVMELFRQRRVEAEEKAGPEFAIRNCRIYDRCFLGRAVLRRRPMFGREGNPFSRNWGGDVAPPYQSEEPLDSSPSAGYG